MNIFDMEEDLFSPLELIYCAYSDQRPTPLQGIREHPELNVQLAALSPTHRQALQKILCQLWICEERRAFLDGFRTGFHLALELSPK